LLLDSMTDVNGSVQNTRTQFAGSNRFAVGWFECICSIVIISSGLFSLGFFVVVDELNDVVYLSTFCMKD
jgi:hypothetical protein